MNEEMILEDFRKLLEDFQRLLNVVDDWLRESGGLPDSDNRFCIITSGVFRILDSMLKKYGVRK